MKLNDEKWKGYNLPVIHYVDLLGLSIGLKPVELELGLRRVDPRPLLERFGS